MSFDRLAPHYRWMERVLAGGKLQRCRTAFLDKIPPPKRALLVGEGNGRFLQEFARRFPNSAATVVDASAEMLVRARRSTANSTNIQFIHADIFAFAGEPAFYDLIVTNFFLDCFTPQQLEIVVPKLASFGASNATWLLADFCEPPAGLRKWRAKWILSSMYLFFRFATRLPARKLTPPDSFLLERGFKRIDRKVFDWGLLHTDMWQRRPATRN